ncbi:MAG TPA: hypothetical protein VF339_16885 [Gammaproteobacteria bacterium]
MKRFKVEVLLVALACFAPLIGAYLLYYLGDLSALPRVQNPDRQLVSPAVPLPPPPGAAAGDGVSGWGPDWSLLYVRTSACDDACREHVVRIAQVHAALGRDRDRVRRVYLGPDADALASRDPKLAAASTADASADALLDALASAGAEPGDGGRLYVVDPHGNLVLSYPADAEQRGLLEDLERLLDVSQIG